jgi:hypothetical protein
MTVPSATTNETIRKAKLTPPITHTIQLQIVVKHFMFHLKRP